MLIVRDRAILKLQRSHAYIICHDSMQIARYYNLSVANACAFGNSSGAREARCHHSLLAIKRPAEVAVR